MVPRQNREQPILQGQYRKSVIVHNTAGIRCAWDGPRFCDNF
jgi:hypothetical protein